jgi:hypothetical protein
MRGSEARSTPEDPAVPALHHSVDQQILRLEARLLAEADGDPDLEQTLRLHVAQACAHFASATVRQFLPILIEREVRRRLAAQ